MLCKLISLRLRGLMHRTSGKNGGGKAPTIFALCMLLICAVSFGTLFYFPGDMLAETLYGTAFAWFYFALAGLLSFGISFVFTVFAAKSELFEAMDNELLLSLPIKPRTILLSRLSILLGSEYLFSFLVMIPAGIAWGGVAGIGFLPAYILGCLCLPLLTASLASVVGWLLALLTANVRRKNLLTMIFYLAFMAFYFYMYSNMQDYVNQTLASYQQISDSMMGWGFLFHWFGQGIADCKWGLLLAVIGISLVLFALAICALSHGFLRISSGSRTARKRKGSKLAYHAANAEKALLKREMKRLVSSPLYMLNCGLGLVMMVVAAVLLAFNANKIHLLLQQLQVPELTTSLFAALLVGVLSTTVCFSAASVSLEGKTLWILRSAPIDAGKILRSKLYLHLILSFAPILILSCTAAVILKCSAAGWSVLVLLPQLINLLCAAFGLMLNLLFPKLDWTNEAVPVKQSLSVFLAMMCPMVLLSGLIVCVFFLYEQIKLLVLTCIVLFTLLSALCFFWLEQKGAARFDRL